VADNWNNQIINAFNPSAFLRYIQNVPCQNSSAETEVFCGCCQSLEAYIKFTAPPLCIFPNSAIKYYITWHSVKASDKKNSLPESASELYRPSVHRLSTKLVTTFAVRGVPHGQRYGSLQLYSQFYRPEPLLFLPSSSSIVLTRLSRPHSRPTTSQKIWQRQNSNPDLWICSQELWPLGYRGGPKLVIALLNKFHTYITRN
jgi:hypothetical protein